MLNLTIIIIFLIRISILIPPIILFIIIFQPQKHIITYVIIFIVYLANFVSHILNPASFKYYNVNTNKPSQHFIRNFSSSGNPNNKPNPYLPNTARLVDRHYRQENKTPNHSNLTATNPNSENYHNNNNQNTNVIDHETNNTIISPNQTNLDHRETTEPGTERRQQEQQQPQQQHRQQQQTTRRNKRPLRLETETVINLSSVNLTESEKSLLERGLNFCPTPQNIDWNELNADLTDFKRRLRLKHYFHENNNNVHDNTETNTETSNKYKKSSGWTPKRGLDPALDSYIDKVEQDINNIQPTKITDNLTNDERNTLNQLTKRTDIIIKPADKGSRQ